MRIADSILGAVLVVGIAACGFNPHPKDGELPCDKGCPAGYYCATADNTCRQKGTVASGGVGATGTVTAGSGGAVGIDAAVTDTGGTTIPIGGAKDSGGKTAAGGVTGIGGTIGAGGIISRTSTGGPGGAGGSGGISGSGGPASGAGTTSALGGTNASTVICGPLRDPENGTVSVPSATYQSTATYSCSGGFALVGSPWRKCLADGTWSTAEPSCQCPNGLLACQGTCVDTQKDKNNCGDCGAACTAASPSTVECVGAKCLVTLVPEHGGANYNSSMHLAVDSTSVYYESDETIHTGGTYSSTTYSVMKVPIVGGAPTPLASGQTFFGGMAVDGNSVYWTNNNGASNAVMKVALSGGPATPLAVGQSYPEGVAVDGTSVYWIADDPTSYFQAIFKAPLVPGTSTSLASGAFIESLALDATSVYLTDGSTVTRISKAGGPSTTLATGESSCTNIAADATGIYWSNFESSSQTWTIRALPFGGTPATLAKGAGIVGGLAVDGTNVYWTTNARTNGSVMRVPVGGGTAVVLAPGQSGPSGIRVDAESVYWVSSGAAIKKLTPK